MSRRSCRRNTAAAFPALAASTQNGLQRLISDHVDTVAKMLDYKDGDDGDDKVDKLCEKCAQVMKQQQLSASSFLARFFDASLLAAQAQLYQKSAKGSAATLADRIATAWANNVKPVADKGKDEKQEVVEDDNSEGDGNPSKRKRDKEEATNKDKEVDVDVDDEAKAEDKEEPKKKAKKKEDIKR